MKFAYRAPLRYISGMMVLGAVVVLVAIWLITDPRPVRVSFLRLSAEHSQYVWVVIGILGLVMIGNGLVARFVGVREIILTPETVSVPKGEISRRMVTIRYADIREVKESAGYRAKTLTIVHSGGRVRVQSSFLESPKTFAGYNRFVANFSRALDASRQPPHSYR